MKLKWRMLTGLTLILSTIATACTGGTTSPSPSGTTPTASADASASANPMAALKAKVQGKSISLGVGSPPNLAEVTSRKAAMILTETFGVTVDFKPLSATTEAAAVLGGSLNAGEVSFTRLAGLKEGGGDPLVFGTNDYKLDYVLAVKDPIKTIQDLKGQAYADGGATGPSVLFNNYCFGKANMKVDDTKVTHLSSSTAVTSAFATDQFVGAMIHADALAQLQAKFPGKFRALCFTYEGVKDTNDVWFTSGDWAKANPDMVTAILVAGMMAARWTYDNKAEWVKLANQYVSDLEAGVAEATYDLYAGQIGLWSVNGALDLDNCARELKSLKALDRIKTDLDCKSFVTLEYQTRAREILGQIKEPK